ncbi:Choline-sulfatase [Rubripirellula amarantea]|uniref:Choline-sulfatase n=1 Tax=Rubripirellula amarantea TaxID=2527999 RepID=A0A5C5WJ22_9BACT|nr:sulfatase [Rubripirellula amarantea]TWT50630.1 Choline-sulfatase [Rubripirellula amarantea]
MNPTKLLVPLAMAITVSLVEPCRGQTTNGQSSAERPNVLMICIDDLNDWVEPLGGHPQVKTPAMAELASRGMNFRNAHCQSPLCNSSRTSLMTSRRPSSTGIYGLGPWFRNVDEFRNITTLPQHFARAGYETYSAGKVYHGGYFQKTPEGIEVEFQHVGPPGRAGIGPPKKLVPPTPGGDHPLVDWGVFDHEESDKGDYQVASWVVDQIGEMESSKPFFMACGFFLPHVPCHTTPKYWDMYPDETLIMPPIDHVERSDCSPFSWYLHWELPEPRLSWLEDNNEHRNLVRAYLSCITFMDTQIARVLEALDQSPYADNTIVCLWSDHGWHLGEKNISGKNTLWERSTHVPLIFVGPGIESGVCEQPAELLDVFPTLADLAGLEVPAELEGVSLKPQVVDPSESRRPAVTEHNPGNYAIRDQRYRLIRYADGSEELYDMVADPNEYSNIIDDSKHAEAASRLREFYIADPRPLAKASHSRILEFKDGRWIWEGKAIDPTRPPMDIAPNTTADLSLIGPAK